LDDTLIIVTSDHGEELMERGRVGHSSCNLHGTLYDESIRVPLIMRYPKKIQAGRVITEQISQIDIMPALFDMLGLPIPEWMEGQSTLPLIQGKKSVFRAEAYSETTPAGWQALAKDDRQIWSVRTSEWKLIKYSGRNACDWRIELFDLRNDPGEHHNLADKRKDIVQSLWPKLEAYIIRALAESQGGDV